MDPRRMFWMAVAMAALAMAMVATMPGSLPLAMFTMSTVMAAAAWLKAPSGERCLCGTRAPEGARFCPHCGARMTGA